MKKGLCFLSALLITMLLFYSFPAYAANVKVTTDTVTSFFESYNATSKSWSALVTSQHRAGAKIVYCLQHKKNVPNSQNYKDTDLMSSYGAKAQKGLQIILENGYPWNNGGLGNKQAEYATANAIRFWLSECNDSQFYNMTDLGGFNATQLRSLAAAGKITKKVRVSNDSYIAALQFSVELLIKARQQTVMNHSLSVSASNVTASLSGSTFSGNTRVTLSEINGGYIVDKSGLPTGSTVTGFTGGSGDTLSISIPASASTANKTYTVKLTGKDDRARSNMRVYNHASNTNYQRVLTCYIGANFMTDIATASFTVSTGAFGQSQPDLIISALSANKSSYTPGETITISATVKNQGSASAGASYTSCSASGFTTQSSSTSALSANGTASKTFSFTAPTVSNATTYTFTVKADANNAVTESNENNNSSSVSVTVSPAAVVSKPDLIVSAVAPAQPSYPVGSTVTVTATIYNQGSVDSSGFFAELRNGNSSRTAYAYSCAAGSSTTVTFTYTAPSTAQTMTLTVMADYYNHIDESNENNNTNTSTVLIVSSTPTVTPTPMPAPTPTPTPAPTYYPDLVISALTPGQASYTTSGTVTVSATVKNQGSASASGFYVSLYNGSSTQTSYVSSLSAGSSTTASFSFTAPSSAQTLTITATADYYNHITESNENNNTRTTAVSIVAPAFPDLTVTSVSPASSSYTAGASVTVYSTVKNQGNANAGTFVVKLTPEGMNSQTQTITSLAAGASKALTWMFTAPVLTATANRSLTVFADSTYAISESNENNNTGTGSVQIIGERPDLSVTALTADASSYKPDERVTITATVRNNGIVTCPASKLRLAGDGITAQTKDVGSITAGGTRTVSFTFAAPHVIGDKTYVITAAADPDNLIAESNENNNTRNGSFTVSNPLPDLTVTRIQASKNEYEEDETGTVTVTVLNQGALGVSNLRIKLTLGSFFSEVKQTGAIPVGSSVRITFTFTAPETLERLTVTATATADPTDEIPESNESNNTMISTLAVKPILPDLGIVNTNAANWYAGKDIVVTATVVNYTKRAVPSVTVRLTIGGRRYEEAIPLPGNGTNLAVFRLTLPTTTGATALSFVVDPYNEIPERNDGNNSLDKTIEIVSVPIGVVLDPDLTELETNYKNNGMLPLPDTTNSDYHIWQEVRLEGESYVTKTYWAQLQTVFAVTPDPRIAYEDYPTRMESGFGIQAHLQTMLTSNYDHPEKLVGVQMAWTFCPESGYKQIPQWSGVFDALEPVSGSAGGKNVIWQYAINPWSESGSRLHYTPLWFPDGQYTILSQAFYAWSPAGQLYWYDAGSVDILGDMYDRVTAIQGR